MSYGGVPLDVKPAWLNVARQGQATASSNNGYAIVTIKVVVLKGDPVFWFEGQLEKIQPMALTNLRLTEPLIGLIAAAAIGSAPPKETT